MLIQFVVAVVVVAVVVVVTAWYDNIRNSNALKNGNNEPILVGLCKFITCIQIHVKQTALQFF